MDCPMLVCDLIFSLDNISPYNIHWKTSLFCTWYVSGARVATFKIYNPYCDKRRADTIIRDWNLKGKTGGQGSREEEGGESSTSAASSPTILRKSSHSLDSQHWYVCPGAPSKLEQSRCSAPGFLTPRRLTQRDPFPCAWLYDMNPVGMGRGALPPTSGDDKWISTWVPSDLLMVAAQSWAEDS